MNVLHRGALALAILLFCCAIPPVAARTWHVPGDAPTIQMGIDLASAGDDVLVAPGDYPEHDILMKAGIWVHSAKGAAETRIDANNFGRCFDCQNLQERSVIEGFTMLHGRIDGDGAGIRSTGGSVAVRGCAFSGCTAYDMGGAIATLQSNVEIRSCTASDCFASTAGGGIATYESFAVIADCQIQRCYGYYGGGIYVDGPIATIDRCSISQCGAALGGGIATHSPHFEVRDCLVVGNYAIDVGVGHGMLLLGSGSVSGCTVAENTGWDIQVILIEGGPTTFERMNCAFNGGLIACIYGPVSFRCCDVYGNAHGDGICGDDLGGNFSADPLFCDAAHGDFTLDGNSPCLPGHDPNGPDCGLIGALGWGCGVPVGACCLDDGSCRLVNQADCTTQHGTYQGDGTTCDPNPCHPTPVRLTTWGRIKSGYR